jgi:hypothetical protein
VALVEVPELKIMLVDKMALLVQQAELPHLHIFLWLVAAVDLYLHR